MTPKEVLEGVRDLYADPTKWTKGEFARIGSSPADPRDPDATCFCLMGGVDLLSGTNYFSDPLVEEGSDVKKVQSALYDAIQEFKGEYVSLDDFNDDASTTLADVRTVINRAIEIVADGSI